MERDVWNREKHFHKHGEEMTPNIGDTVIALTRHYAKVLAINSDGTANVMIVTETPLPDGAGVIVNNVPFACISEDVDAE